MKQADFETTAAAGRPAMRRVPLQARGQATVATILDAAAGLLEDVGHDSVTTNSIAGASGINIATLYQYFSNKQAILLALYDRQNTARRIAIEGVMANFGSGRPWAAITGEALDAIVALRRRQRGSVAVRRAICSSPELRDHDRESALQTAAMMAPLLCRVAPGLDIESARRIARTAVELSSALTDAWLLEGGTDERMLEEAKIAVIAYLGTYLDAPVSRVAARAAV